MHAHFTLENKNPTLGQVSFRSLSNTRIFYVSGRVRPRVGSVKFQALDDSLGEQDPRGHFPKRRSSKLAGGLTQAVLRTSLPTSLCTNYVERQMDASRTVQQRQISTAIFIYNVN